MRQASLTISLQKERGGPRLEGPRSVAPGPKLYPFGGLFFFDRIMEFGLGLGAGVDLHWNDLDSCPRLELKSPYS